MISFRIIQPLTFDMLRSVQVHLQDIASVCVGGYRTGGTSSELDPSLHRPARIIAWISEPERHQYRDDVPMGLWTPHRAKIHRYFDPSRDGHFRFHRISGIYHHIE